MTMRTSVDILQDLLANPANPSGDRIIEAFYRSAQLTNSMVDTTHYKDIPGTWDECRDKLKNIQERIQANLPDLILHRLIRLSAEDFLVVYFIGTFTRAASIQAVYHIHANFHPDPPTCSGKMDDDGYPEFDASKPQTGSVHIRARVIREKGSDNIIEQIIAVK